MQGSNKVYLFGYSGHSYVIIESLLDLGYKIEGYFDIQRAKKNPFELNFLGLEKDVNVSNIVSDDFVFPCVGNNLIRENLINYFHKNNLRQFAIIDPTAKVSKSAIIGNSTYVGRNVVINALCEVGIGVILNTGCIVEHECNINDYTHIAPGAVLCGNVKVGKNCLIGSNGIVKEGIVLGDHITIGAGSVVLKNIFEKGVWVGNKLRKI